MAHKISKRDRQEGIFMGWHKLTVLKDYIDLNDCFLTEWDIQPRYLELDGVPTEFKIFVGSDDNKPIGKPYTDSYKPITNKMFLEMIKDAISNIPGAVIESVGSVCNRGRIFVSISLKDTAMYKIGNREFKDYLNFGSGHDQSSALWVTNTNICTVCDNTFTMNLFSGYTKINGRVQHRGNVADNISNIVEIVDAHLGTQEMFKAEFERLMKQPLDFEQAGKLFAGWVMRSDEEKVLSDKQASRVNRLLEIFKNGKGNRGENRADAFSAVTDYYTHESTRGGGKNVGSQFVSSEFGIGRTAKENFWDIIRNDDAISKYVTEGEMALAKT